MHLAVSAAHTGGSRSVKLNCVAHQEGGTTHQPRPCAQAQSDTRLPTFQWRCAPRRPDRPFYRLTRPQTDPSLHTRRPDRNGLSVGATHRADFGQITKKFAKITFFSSDLSPRSCTNFEKVGSILSLPSK